MCLLTDKFEKSKTSWKSQNRGSCKIKTGIDWKGKVLCDFWSSFFDGSCKWNTRFAFRMIIGTKADEIAFSVWRYVWLDDSWSGSHNRRSVDWWFEIEGLLIEGKDSLVKIDAWWRTYTTLMGFLCGDFKGYRWIAKVLISNLIDIGINCCWLLNSKLGYLDFVNWVDFDVDGCILENEVNNWRNSIVNALGK